MVSFLIVSLFNVLDLNLFFVHLLLIFLVQILISL